MLAWQGVGVAGETGPKTPTNKIIMKTPKTLIVLAFVGTALSLHAEEIKLEAAPAVVQETIRANARDGKIEEIDFLAIEDRTLYVAEINLAGGKDLKVHVSGDGKLVKTSEDAVLTDAPAAVQEAAKKLVPEGGKIEDVDKEVAAGKTTYEVDIERPNAGDLKVVLAEDGSVVKQTEEAKD